MTEVPRDTDFVRLHTEGGDTIGRTVGAATVELKRRRTTPTAQELLAGLSVTLALSELRDLALAEANNTGEDDADA